MCCLDQIRVFNPYNRTKIQKNWVDLFLFPTFMVWTSVFETFLVSVTKIRQYWQYPISGHGSANWKQLVLYHQKERSFPDFWNVSVNHSMKINNVRCRFSRNISWTPIIIYLPFKFCGASGNSWEGFLNSQLIPFYQNRQLPVLENCAELFLWMKWYGAWNKKTRLKNLSITMNKNKYQEK